MEPNDNLVSGNEKIPVDFNANGDHVRRNIKDAEIRIEELQQLRNSLTQTLSQINRNAETHKKEIEETFSSVTEVLVNALNEKRNNLLQEITGHVEAAVLPILASQEAIDLSLQSAREYLDKANKMIHTRNNDDINLSPLSQDASVVENLTESLLSSEPALNLSVYFNQSLIKQTLDDLFKFGSILNMSSIQIVETKERPGALAIRWEEKEYETEADSNFRLQYCVGDVRKNKSLVDTFVDVYVGSETSYVVRHVNPNTDYSFRVCRHCAPELDWSLPLVAQTNLLPYVWSTGNPCFSITNDGKTAAKVAYGRSTLFSSSPQFKYKHSTQFKILHCASSFFDEDGVGLWIPTASSESGDAVQPGVILVCAEGYVYVNGVKMTTRLPRFAKGSVITFDSDEQLSANKMRVTITHEEKQVTYDWNLDCGSSKVEGSTLNSDSVYFFMMFREVGWSVVVQ